jgi:hypothetical protein
VSGLAVGIHRNVPFWTLVVLLGMLLFASSVPSPLYVVYQHEWGFSTIALTGVFAVYALALLGALLVVGSISDHIGRRPASGGSSLPGSSRDWPRGRRWERSARRCSTCSHVRGPGWAP